MFHSWWNVMDSGTSPQRLFNGLLRRLAERLPLGWTMDAPPDGGREPMADVRLVVRDPSGLEGGMSVQVKMRVEPRDVFALSRSDGPRMVVAPFLSPRTRDLLIDAGLSFADATGNLRFVIDQPAVWIETQGADSDPHREVRPLASLRGASSGRVVRAVLDFRPPYGVRQLARASDTPLGSVSRVVTLLENEALIERDEHKQIVAVDWEQVLRRWASDYDVQTSNRLLACLEPRGLPALANKLLGFPHRYSLTGTMSRLAMIYVEDADQAATRLRLTPVDEGANVWLLEPFDGVVFERTRSTPDLTDSPTTPSRTYAAVTQVVVDLLTSPGRGPEQAEMLIEKMRENDGWRRDI